MTCDLSAYPLPKRPTGFDEDGSPLPGDLREIHPDAIWNDKKMEGIKNVINNHKNKEVYTRNQMILFAGYCMGKLRREPDKDVGEIVDEFREKFYIK
jgi:D-mannonate dehydratase